VRQAVELQVQPTATDIKINVLAGVPQGIRLDKLGCLFKKTVNKYQTQINYPQQLGKMASIWEKKNRQEFG
jgi:hypothetical protein